MATPTTVRDAFDTAASPRDLQRAERLARTLAPHDQLLVVSSLLAAEKRLKAGSK
jgi:hypothetical protein